jgi:putative ABC transport system permease protein
MQVRHGGRGETDAVSSLVGMLREIGQSSRRLRKRPGLAVTAIVTLALAIGANTAIFSLLDTVALRPLPYRDADRLVQIGAAVTGQKDLQEVSWPKFQALAAQSRETAALTAYYQGAFGLTEKDRPEQLSGERVSGGFFAVWGVRPILGRTFSAEEQKRGGPNVVLLSNAYWQKRFAGDRAVLGRSLDVEGVPTTVVGVLPDVLRFPFGDVQIWLPRPDDANFLSRRALELGAGYLQVAARLRPGVSLAAAQREIDRVTAAYKASLPGQLDIRYPLAAVPMNELLVGASRTTLLVLLAAVGLVLLIACADVANLLLADGLSRRREIAACVALGAGRRQIFGQALRESLLIAGAGGLLGVFLAYWGLQLLVAANPADLPRIGEAEISGRALAFAVLVTAMAGVLAGLAPAWQTLRTDPKSFLAEGERGAAGGVRASWGQGLLVTFQIALALVLLSAAGLLLRSLERVNGMALGFAPDHLLFVQVTLPDAKYPGVAERRVFFEGLLDRVRALPGVQSAALVETPPVGGGSHTKLTVEGQAPLPPDQQPLVLRVIAGAGYFRTLETRFLAGRDFDPKVAPDAPPTAIITRALRDLYFAGKSPLGQHLLLRGATSPVEVVGVVEDVQQQPLEEGIEPMVFLFQHQAGPDLSPPNFMNLAIRTNLPVAGVAAALRREVSALDPGEPLPEMTTMSALLATATARRRLTTGLFSGFSALALVLCLLGIYGVVAHSIFLRRREIGVRMALGAAKGQVLENVLRLGARWIVPGLVLGAIGSYFAGRALASQLFEVAPTDWLHFAAAAALLGGIAFLACLLPARKATRIDPAVTLRTP